MILEFKTKPMSPIESLWPLLWSLSPHCHFHTLWHSKSSCIANKLWLYARKAWFFFSFSFLLFQSFGLLHSPFSFCRIFFLYFTTWWENFYLNNTKTKLKTLDFSALRWKSFCSLCHFNQTEKYLTFSAREEAASQSGILI